MKPYALLALTLVAACSGTPAAQDPSVAANLEVYKTGYVATCATGAIKAGWADEQAHQLCRCAVDDLARTNSMAELRTLTVEKVEAASERCLAKIENENG